MVDSITWKIGGEAGFGIMASGTMLARAFSRAGYHVLGTNEYPSLIRGGHNLITVKIANHTFESMDRNVHMLVALNKETVELHREELREGSLVIYDPNDYQWKATDFSTKVVLVGLPLTQILKESGGEPVMRNTVALGATIALLGADLALLEVVIRDQFRKKGDSVISGNIAIATLGYDYIKRQYGKETSVFLSKVERKEPLLVLNASEAVGIGAVRAGLKFASIYPMTPINALITFLADHEKQLGIVYMQPEDEIAGINMAVGASVAGVRSMVATSGGGFALMVEGVALAGMLEVPLVIDMGMRPGPATGMPTWTEQGELQFIIHAGHGEFPRIVLAPGDGTEAYKLTIEAFNLADKYQTPVFILTDKYLNESQWCVPMSVFESEVKIDRGRYVGSDALPAGGEFKRYDLSAADGISPRSRPGQKNGYYIANSYEHIEDGHLTDAPDARTRMTDKRMKKLEAMQKDVKAPTLVGDSKAEITFVSWGSTKGAVTEAIKLLQAKGRSARLVHFSWLYPFPAKQTKDVLSGASRIIDVEQNATGQLASLIREYTGIEITEKVLKYDGRPFYPEEIVERLG